MDCTFDNEPTAANKATNQKKIGKSKHISYRFTLLLIYSWMNNKFVGYDRIFDCI